MTTNSPKDVLIFETQNVDLATYLMMEGIRFLECQKSPTNPKVIILRFLDERQNCLDLERSFLNSQFKRFRDMNKYLLGKVHETLRGD